MIFKYKGLDKNGKKTKGLLEATSLEEAKNKLKFQGILYSSVQEENYFLKDFLSDIFAKEISHKKLSQISRNLSIYLKSGVSSIVCAVKLEKQQHKEVKKLSTFFDSIETFLEEGKSFYVAIDTQKVFKVPIFYKQAIKVAEESGNLGVVLKELSEFLKKQEIIKGRVSQAMVYPMFIVLVSSFMVGFMLSVVVPKITLMFDQIGQELPLITRIIISLGEGVKEYGLIIVFGILVIFTIVAYMYKNTKKIKLKLDRFVLFSPLVGKIIQTSELAKFSYIVSVLLSSGVTLVQAVKLSSNTIKNQFLLDIFSNASNELVKGKKLSTALINQSYQIDTSFIQAISLGEETSQMQDILQNLSELYAEENKDKINIMLSLLEPLLILFVGVIIGIIVTAMLLPIFSMDLQI